MRKYELVKGYASARIDGKNYSVSEPRLSDEEKEKIEKIKNAVIELTDIDLASIKDPTIARESLTREIREAIKDLGYKFPEKKEKKILYFLLRDFLGLGKIEPLMRDSAIEDISCDGLKIPIYVTHRDFGSLKTNIAFDFEDELNSFIIMLSQRCGRYVSYAEPLLDGSLPDGSRVQITFGKDITTRGSTFTIRKFRAEPLSPMELIENKTLSSEILAYLWTAIENSCSILIAGATATGKTTLLNTISLFIPQEMKIVSIEDTRELNLPHENWIPAVSRTGFGPPAESGEKYGEVSMFDLLKESFRERPDYVIVGEVRGKEAYVLFQGMASGHPTLGTMHADSAESVLRRLTTPPISLSPELINTLDAVIVLTFCKKGKRWVRRIKEINEMGGIDPKSERPILDKSFVWIPTNDSYDYSGSSQIIGEISMRRGLSEEDVMNEMAEKKKVIDYMSKKKIRHFSDVAKILSEYYENKERLMKRI